MVGDQFGAPTSARGIAKTIAMLVLQMTDAEIPDARWGAYHLRVIHSFRGRSS